MGPDIAGRSFRQQSISSAHTVSRPSGILLSKWDRFDIQLSVVEMELSLLLAVALEERWASPIFVLAIAVEVEATSLCDPGNPCFQLLAVGS